MNTLQNFYKKLHKWPGLFISFILLYYAVTGILLNHRGFFSGIDINRRLLPGNYSYKNWNNAALKGNLLISRDSCLLYGNIGIWLTDSGFSKYSSFNTGLPKGIDNRKIFDIHKMPDGRLYAATLFGLYSYNHSAKAWGKIVLNDNNQRITGIENIGDTIFVINRSHLFRGKSAGINTLFTRIELPAPEEYKNKITLFKTLWQIHSGEILGLPGQLFVDILGLITIFLSVTGLVYFFFPHFIKQRFRKNKPATQLIRINSWSLKWHNLTGAWTFVFLLILFFTGMFLRPPLLIAIGKTSVGPIKYTALDQPNPWFDKLRDILYDSDKEVFLLSTSEGMYHFKENNLKPVLFHNQPPVSVMGINSLKIHNSGTYIIGSFSGLFLWNPDSINSYNFITGGLFDNNITGRPVGDYKITGTLIDFKKNMYFVDYEQGIIPLHHHHEYPVMSQAIVNESAISLWNLCLEIHTGRFFQNILGNFYILMVPLSGLTGIIVVLSGYLLWRKKYRKKKN